MHEYIMLTNSTHMHECIPITTNDTLICTNIHTQHNQLKVAVAPPTDFVLLPVVDVGRAHVGGVVSAEDAAVVVHDARQVVDWRRLTARYAAHEVWAHVQRPALNSGATHDTASGALNKIIYLSWKSRFS